MKYNMDKGIIQNAVEVLGEETLVLIMEECSELQKECSKEFRRKGNKQNIIEEIGDVLICIEYMRLMLDIPEKEIQESIDYKMLRTEERLALNTLTNRRTK